ncbi:hypothetical protein BDQ17DRAFT_751602 [Cyathus striatus]|nr:hypothetical protein BDQ17DRAFT_751602 [Cyathus striatus]
MLSMPAVWLAWSTLLFLLSTLSYIWRTGSLSDHTREPLSSREALAPRVVITLVLRLGVVYLGMIVRVLRYGSREGVREILGARAGSPLPGSSTVEVGGR